MKKRELKRQIMQVLKRKELHGYYIANRLTALGLPIHLGYLYQTLDEMEKEGLLVSRWEKSEAGPERRL